MKTHSDTESELLAIRGISKVREIASRSLDSDGLTAELIRCCESPDARIAAMASWVISHASDMDKDVFSEEQQIRLLGIADSTPFSAVRRNVLHIWQKGRIPESAVSEMTDTALRFLSDPAQDIAVRAYSITILEHCMRRIPEISEEVHFLLEREMPFAGAAIRARAKRFIRAASRLYRNKQG